MAYLGDVLTIPDWPSTYTFNDLKKMVVDNGWSSITIGKAGTVN